MDIPDTDFKGTPPWIPPQTEGNGIFKYTLKQPRSSCCGAVETNPTRNHEVAGLIPGLAQWVKDPAWQRASV